MFRSTVTKPLTRSFSHTVDVLLLPQELKGNTEMVPEVEIFLHVDDIVAVVLVFPPHYIQDLQFNKSLVVEPRQDQSTHVTLTSLQRSQYHLMISVISNQGCDSRKQLTSCYFAQGEANFSEHKTTATSVCCESFWWPPAHCSYGPDISELVRRTPFRSRQGPQSGTRFGRAGPGQAHDKASLSNWYENLQVIFKHIEYLKVVKDLSFSYEFVAFPVVYIIPHRQFPVVYITHNRTTSDLKHLPWCSFHSRHHNHSSGICCDWPQSSLSPGQGTKFQSSPWSLLAQTLSAGLGSVSVLLYRLGCGGGGDHKCNYISNYKSGLPSSSPFANLPAQTSLVKYQV